MEQEMNRHENLYRRSGRALIVLLGLWMAAILLALALPAKLWKTGPTSFIFFGGIFPILFVAAVVFGVVKIVAYIRWTGKYPYYFLFSKTPRPRNRRDGKNGDSV
jgi:hypothetical protein